MRISPTRIWTPVSTSQKTDGIFTLCRMIPEHPERYHQAMANSHTVHGVLGYLMSLISTRRKIVWAGKLRWMRKLDSNFKSLQRKVSIHSMTGVFRRCGCFQVRLKIQKMILWSKCTAPMRCILRWRVWCMLSGLTLNKLNKMRNTGWSNLQSPGRSQGGQNWNLRMGNHLFRYRRRMHTLLISNELKKTKQNWRSLWRDTLHGVLQERGGFVERGWHASHWYWVTPRIGMTFLENGTMNGHSTLGWILQFPDCWETHLCKCLSRNLQCIRSLVKMTHQMRRSCMILKVIEAPCLVHLLLKRSCYLVCCQAKFIIWSGGLQSFYADHLDIFYMYEEMGNNESSEMQLKFQHSPNPSVFVTTPKVGGTGLNPKAANHTVITQKFWVLNEQRQAFAQVVRLGPNSVSHTWLLNTGPSDYDNRASDLHQLSGVAQMWVLHGLMSRPNITTSMIYRILECPKDQRKQVTEQGDVVPSDGGDER